ncbi:phage lysozyme [Candidatus Hepatincola sp. Av]
MSSNNLNTNIIIKLKDLFSAPLRKIATNFSKLEQNKALQKTGKDAETTDKKVQKLNKSLNKNKDLMGSLRDIAQVWAGAKFLQAPLSALTGREEVEFGLGTLSKNLEQFKTLAQQISSSGLYGYNETMEGFSSLLAGGLPTEQTKIISKPIQLATTSSSSLKEAQTIIGAVKILAIPLEIVKNVAAKMPSKYTFSSVEQLLVGHSKLVNSTKLDSISFKRVWGLLNSNMAEILGKATNIVSQKLSKVAKNGINIVRGSVSNLGFLTNLRSIKNTMAGIQEKGIKNIAFSYFFSDEVMLSIQQLWTKINSLKQGIAALAIKSINLAKTFFNSFGIINVLKLGLKKFISSLGLSSLLINGLTILKKLGNAVKLFQKMMSYFKNVSLGKLITSGLNIVGAKQNIIKNGTENIKTILANGSDNIPHSKGNNIIAEVINAQNKSFQQLQLAGFYGK